MNYRYVGKIQEKPIKLNSDITIASRTTVKLLGTYMYVDGKYTLPRTYFKFML